MKAVHFILPVSNKKRVKQLILACLRQNVMSQMDDFVPIMLRPENASALQDHEHRHIVHCRCHQHMPVPDRAVEGQVVAQVKQRAKGE